MIWNEGFNQTQRFWHIRSGVERKPHTKKNVVATAVDKIKERYGENAKDFIAAVQKTGVDKVKDFIVHSVLPEIDRSKTNELDADYDGILTGLVSWIMLELQLKKDK